MICKCGKEYEPRHERDIMCLGCYSKQGTRSKNKGRTNESRFAKNVQKKIDNVELPIKIKRTPASGAIHEFEPGDLIVTQGYDTVFAKIHWELKDTKTWQIENWMQKAMEQEEEIGEPASGIAKGDAALSTAEDEEGGE